MKIDPYMQRQKCRPMTLVSGNIRYMQIAYSRGFLLAGTSNERVGLLATAIFGDLSGYFFGNFGDKTSIIIWRCATPCWPVTDCKMNDLVTLSGYFTVFALAVLDSEGSTLKHNYVKTNVCRPILSAAKM